jgi:P27 family predicted phage terminase small subunit
MGTLTTSDRSVISLYVRSWQRWVQAEEGIEQSGPVVAAPKTKVPQHNLWISISNKAHEQCVRLLGELGLTPRSRSIISKNAAMGGSAEEATVDDFADLD